MLNKLYVFAIGGSGERVMHSFLMELVAGMPINATIVVPVFVDNDTDSPALNLCRNVIDYYNGSGYNGKILGAQTMNKEYSTQQSDWSSFYHVKIANPITLNMSGAGIGTLDNVIGPLDNQNVIQHDIIEEKELLFSKDDLEMPLNVGFVGNPNIGSVVLNSKSLQTQEFLQIKNSVTQNDGVIVIGSLFGGTGAAGLPLIAHQFESIAKAQRPLLGAIAVLPYFKTNTAIRQDQAIINTEKWDVKSDSFDTKTRAALMYYDEHLNQLDYQYYVGCDNKATYAHNVGSKVQRNPVHLVEVLSAMSIFDFAKQSRPEKIVYKIPTWDVDKNGDSNVLGITNKDLRKAIVKFQLMIMLMQNEKFIKDDIINNQSYVHNLGITETIRKAIIDDSNDFTYVAGLNKLIKEWCNWLNGLATAETAKISIIKNDKKEKVSHDNIMEAFYGRDPFGIARTRMEGFFSREEKTIAPQVANKLKMAYLKLYPNGNANEAATLADCARVPALLKIISDAVDSMIQDSTILCPEND